MAKRGPQPEDLAGQRFGRLIAQEYAGKDSGGRSQWLCLCDCGNTRIAASRHLKYGEIASCGCLQIATGRKNIRKAHLSNTGKHHSAIHGHSPNAREGKASRAYNTWRCMRRRCNDPHFHNYHKYGARGITVCDRWNEFLNFLEDMGEPPIGHTLHRSDHDGNYEPSNCQWMLRGHH